MRCEGVKSTGGIFAPIGAVCAIGEGRLSPEGGPACAAENAWMTSSDGRWSGTVCPNERCTGCPCGGGAPAAGWGGGVPAAGRGGSNAIVAANGTF